MVQTQVYTNHTIGGVATLMSNSSNPAHNVANTTDSPGSCGFLALGMVVNICEWPYHTEVQDLSSEVRDYQIHHLHVITHN